VVYFFDNCVEGPNGLIENLGDVLGDVLNLIRYDNGTLVPQVDLVSHSMGGLIVRAYLSGLQPNGAISPPANPRVRKFIEIAAPNFGSFLAANNSILLAGGTQAPEMFPGAPSYGTWQPGTNAATIYVVLTPWQSSAMQGTGRRATSPFQNRLV
jgi:triacylglycerol esterase/lipase EstA (alpha/beta hydrolase family)